MLSFHQIIISVRWAEDVIARGGHEVRQMAGEPAVLRLYNIVGSASRQNVTHILSVMLARQMAKAEYNTRSQTTAYHACSPHIRSPFGRCN